MSRESKYFDKHGKPIYSIEPPVRASKLREIYKEANAEDSLGNYSVKVIRDQRPFLVLLMEFNSSFQITPTPRYVFLYAKKASNAQKKAVAWWKKLFNPDWGTVAESYPELQGAAVAYGLEDADYEDIWKSLRDKPEDRNLLGHPEDPFGIMVMQEGFNLHKIVAPDAGLDYDIAAALRSVEKLNKNNPNNN